MTTDCLPHQVYKHHAVSKVLREAARAEARAEAIASVSASARALADASRSARSEVMALIEEVARRARAEPPTLVEGSFSGRAAARPCKAAHEEPRTSPDGLSPP